MNPFNKFKTYEEKDRDSFLGREQDILALSALIKTNAVTVCYSDSGIGKSSLINAGISPRLKKENYFPIYVLFDSISDETDFDSDIINDLNDQHTLLKIWNNGVKEGSLQHKRTIGLNKNRTIAITTEREDCDIKFYFDCNFSETDELMLELDKELSGKSLWWFLRTRDLICEIKGVPFVYQPLFVFDQFEELFTKAKDFESCSFFFLWFKELLSDEAPEIVQEKYRELLFRYIEEGKATQDLPHQECVKALFLIRRDYIGQLDYWTIQRQDTYIASFQSNRYFLRPLSLKQAEDVITRQGYDKTLEPWKSQILSCSKDVNDGYSTMLLSVICHDVYENAKTYEQIFEYQDEYESLGDYILSRIYENALTASGVKKKYIKVIEDDLVDEHGNRRRIYTDDKNYKLGSTKNINTIISALAKQGIVKWTSDNNSSEDRKLVELVHDRIADVIVKKRKQFNRQRLITVIKSYLLFIITIMIMTIFIGVWFPGVFNWNNSFEHGKYPASSNNHIYYGKTFKYSELIKINNINGESQVEKLVIDENNVVVNFDEYPNLVEVLIPKEIGELTINLNAFHWSRRRVEINCPEVTIKGSLKNIDLYIGKDVNKINLYNISQSKDDKFSISISEDNTRYIFYKNILWDTIDHEITFAPKDVDTFIEFPSSFEKDSTIYWGYKLELKNSLLIKPDAATPNIVDNTLKKLNGIAIGTIDLSNYDLTEIGEGAFKNCEKIDSIILPTCIKKIKEYAFKNCSSLKYINTEQLDSLEVIGHFAFENCISLERLVLPNSLSTIDFGFLEGCRSIQYIQFPDKIDKIDLSNIDNDYDLTIKLPSFVRIIEPPTIKGVHRIINYNANINYILDNSKPTNLRYECDGLITVWSDTCFRDIVSYITNYKLTNITPQILSTLRQLDSSLVWEDGILSSKSGIIFVTEKTKKTFRKVGINSYIYSKIIYNNKNEKEINLRGISDLDTLVFTEHCDSLRKLHIPLSEVSNFEILGIPSHLRENIILYVPWNCKNKYYLNRNFDGFKEIKEDPLYKRFIDLFYFYIINASRYLKVSLLELILLVLLVVAVTFIGCLGVVSIMKKRKIPKSKFRRKVFITSIQMLILAAIGFIILYWFSWIVIFDSYENINTKIISIFLGVIGAFSIPWIWIFSEEFDLARFSIVLKSSPLIIKSSLNAILNWLIKLLNIAGCNIAKHWIISIFVLSAISLIYVLNDIQKKNNNLISKNIENYEDSEKWSTSRQHEKDSLLKETLNLYPKVQSLFIPADLYNKYDSIISFEYNQLVGYEKIPFADTITNHVKTIGFLEYMYDKSQKTVYLGPDPIIRYDVSSGNKDSLTIPKSIPNDSIIYCLNDCIYYLSYKGSDSISVHKLSNVLNNYSDSCIFTLPNKNEIQLSSYNNKKAYFIISKDEKYAIIYSHYYYSFIQCWDIIKNEKIFERENVDVRCCCFVSNSFYYFDDYKGTLYQVNLCDNNPSEKEVLSTKSLIQIVEKENGNLLLHHGWTGDIEEYDITNQKTKHIVSHMGDIIDGSDRLYIISNNGDLLEYKIKDVTLKDKVNAIKQYLNK